MGPGSVASLVARQVAAGTRGATVSWAPGRVAWGDGRNRSYQVTVSELTGADIKHREVARNNLVAACKETTK